MRKYLWINLLIVFSLLMNNFIFAEEKLAQLPPKVEVPLTDPFSQRFSLELKDMEISEALRYLASKTGLNIVTTKNVSGRINLSVDNVLLKDIFDIILRSNGLAYAKQGEIYTVMTEAEYKALYGKNFSDMRQVVVFRLKYAIPEQAFSLLDALKSEIGRVLVDPESGNVMIMDIPEKIEVMRKALEEFEKQNLVKVFDLKYAKAKEVEEILRGHLEAKKVGFVKADERNNQVIVQTLPERMDEVSRLIKDLDKPTKEVLIDAKIVKIKLSDQLDSGIEWEGLFALAKKTGLTYLGSYPFSSVQSATAAWRSREQVVSDMNGSVGSYPFSGTTTNYSASTKVSPGEKLHIGMITPETDFDVLFKLLQTLGETRILSNPKIAVVNNQEARIHVGERQAYVTTTTTTGQTTSTVAEEVTFVDVGIQLAVTPSINEEGFITMKIKPEVSSVASILTTPTGNKIPIIDTSTVETTVMIKDKTTLILGGLRKEEITRTSEQFPVLGKIPILNLFFSNRSSKKDRTEILVLITPHIITGEVMPVIDERKVEGQPGKSYRPYSPFAKEKIETQPKSFRELSKEDYER
jgi:type II secretory pathway component GspD/PulD (secretin)